jgi:hypothetical protein
VGSIPIDGSQTLRKKIGFGLDGIRRRFRKPFWGKQCQ